MTYTFGDGSYLGKENEKKEGQPPNLLLEPEQERKDDRSDIPKFPPGGVVRGLLMVENGGMLRIRKATVRLRGIEHSKWRRSRLVSENIKEEIRYNHNKDMDTVAFGIQIPKG
jgi:hypothetical protein